MERNIKSDPVRYLEVVKVKRPPFFLIVLFLLILLLPKVSSSVELDGNKPRVFIGNSYFALASRPAERGTFGEGIQDEYMVEFFNVESVDDIGSDMLGNELNHAKIDFNDSEYSWALVVQEGNRNYADVHVDGDGNLAVVKQFGYENLALLAQVGDGNIAKILQYENGNTALVIQLGDENYAKVIQESSGLRLNNRVSILQDGNNHKAFILAGSGTDVGISQVSSVQSNTMIVNASGAMRIDIKHGN